MLELLSLPQPPFGGDYWNTSKALASSQQPDVPLGKLYSGVRRRSRQHQPPGCQPERCGDTSSPGAPRRDADPAAAKPMGPAASMAFLQTTCHEGLTSDPLL